MCDWSKRLVVYIMQQLHLLESAESRSWAAPARAGGAVFSFNSNAKSVFSSQLSIKAGQEVDPGQYSVLSLWCRQSVFNLPTLADSMSTTFCYWFCNLLIFTYTFFLYVHSIGWFSNRFYSFLKHDNCLCIIFLMKNGLTKEIVCPILFKLYKLQTCA